MKTAPKSNLKKGFCRASKRVSESRIKTHEKDLILKGSMSKFNKKIWFLGDFEEGDC